MGSIYIKDVEAFKEYSNFASLKEFNSEIEMFLSVHKDEFTKSEYILFKRLTKFCAKVYGVSNASIRTILSAAKEHDLDGKSVSESTFHRMKRKAMMLGILESIETKREDNSQSANLWVFKRMPVNNNDIPSQGKEEHETLVEQGSLNDEKTSLKASKHIKTNIPLTSTEAELDYTYLPENVDQSFIDTVQPFFQKAQEIYALWQLTLTAYRESHLPMSIEEVQETVRKAFRTSIFYYKGGKVKKSFKGYFYTVLKDYFNVLYRENLFQTHDLYFNWLEA